MTKFYKHVIRKNSLLRILWTISISLGLVAFIISIGLHNEHEGFDRGIMVADALCKKLPSNIVLSNSPTRTYEDFANKYETIIWFLGLFLIGKLLEAKLIYKLFGIAASSLSQLICISSLGLTLYWFRELFLIKFARLQESSPSEHFDDLLRSSALFDWICLYIVVALIIIQIIGLFFSRFYKKSKEVIS